MREERGGRGPRAFARAWGRGAPSRPGAHPGHARRLAAGVVRGPTASVRDRRDRKRSRGAGLARPRRPDSHPPTNSPPGASRPPMSAFGKSTACRARGWARGGCSIRSSGGGGGGGAGRRRRRRPSERPCALCNQSGRGRVLCCGERCVQLYSGACVVGEGSVARLSFFSTPYPARLSARCRMAGRRARGRALRASRAGVCGLAAHPSDPPPSPSRLTLSRRRRPAAPSLSTPGRHYVVRRPAGPSTHLARRRDGSARPSPPRGAPQVALAARPAPELPHSAHGDIDGVPTAGGGATAAARRARAVGDRRVSQQTVRARARAGRAMDHDAANGGVEGRAVLGVGRGERDGGRSARRARGVTWSTGVARRRRSSRHRATERRARLGGRRGAAAGARPQRPAATRHRHDAPTLVLQPPPPTFHPPPQVRPTDIDEFNVVRNTVFHEYLLMSEGEGEAGLVGGGRRRSPRARARREATPAVGPRSLPSPFQSITRPLAPPPSPWPPRSRPASSR